MNKYKEAIEAIEDTINNIYNESFNKSGRFSVQYHHKEYTRFAEGKNADKNVDKTVLVKLVFQRPDFPEHHIISMVYEFNPSLIMGATEEDLINNFYKQFLTNLIRFILFGKDTNNLHGGDKPIVVKRIQTLMEEDEK